MPRVLANRYELGDEIGAGGMARVYRASDRFLDRDVALKLLDGSAARSADPATHERFLNEARSAASFHHPNAVAVYDAGEADGDLFIVMELVTGRTLAERLARDGTIPASEAVEIALQVLGALAAMHELHIVHRDVKPSNVLLDDHGRVKLTDFGIAKRLDEIDESLTSAGMVIGTPRYLAPEQAVGGDITPMTDVYLVGAVLYEMLTGTRPVSSVGGTHSRSTDPRDRRADVAERLAEVVVRALSFLPEQRFPSATAMTAALHATTTAHAATSTVPSTSAAVPGGADDEHTKEMRASDPTPPTQVMPAEPLPAHDSASITDDEVDDPPPATSEMPLAPPDADAASSVGLGVRVLYAVLASIAVVLIVTMVVALATSDDGSTRATADEGAPVDGAEFLIRLRSDPEQFGSRGVDLLDELNRVLAVSDASERDAATEALRVDIFVWVAEGDLDTSVGALVEDALARD